MLETMLKAKRVMDRLGIKFWLDAGSLLWAYRDNAPDDTDTDFSIMSEDIQRLQDNLEEFYKEGFTLYNVWQNPALGTVEISIIDSNNKKVDFFGKWIKGDVAFHIATSEQTPIPYKQPAKHIQSLDTLEFAGETWNIPSEVEEYLSCYYGSDWRVHKPVWGWTKDAPCIDKDFNIEKGGK